MLSDPSPCIRFPCITNPEMFSMWFGGWVGEAVDGSKTNLSNCSLQNVLVVVQVLGFELQLTKVSTANQKNPLRMYLSCCKAADFLL